MHLTAPQGNRQSGIGFITGKPPSSALTFGRSAHAQPKTGTATIAMAAFSEARSCPWSARSARHTAANTTQAHQPATGIDIWKTVLPSALVRHAGPFALLTRDAVPSGPVPPDPA